MDKKGIQIKKVKRNFDNDSCWEAYCPCCPQCNCDCKFDCSCGCNCTKKNIIIPPFIISAIAFFLIIVEMLTKTSDTDSYKQFKLTDKIILENNYHISGTNWDDITLIEQLEDKYTLTLIVISFIIFIIYLILLLCFMYEYSCCTNYNPKCKRPYYFILMLINFFGCLGNSMISFIFLSYRKELINDFRNNSFFDDEFGKSNDLNISLNVICAFAYFACFVLHLIVYYYLYKEDGICAGCCSEILQCINSIKNCFKCLICCCCCYCCCCEKPRKKKGRNINKEKTQKIVDVLPGNKNYIISPFNNNVRNSIIQNPLSPENSQMRSFMNNNNNSAKLIIENDNSFQNAIYDYNYSQFKICSICKCFFRKGERITILNCGHVFHTDCSDNWFISNKNCPADETIEVN